MEGRQEIVRDARGHPRDAIGSCRGYQKQIDGPREKNVVEASLEVIARILAFEHVHIDFIPGQRAECQRRDETPRVSRHDDHDVETLIL